MQLCLSNLCRLKPIPHKTVIILTTNGMRAKHSTEKNSRFKSIFISFTKICTDISIYTSVNNRYNFLTFPLIQKCTVIEN